MKVSVIVPTIESRKELLKETLESVKNQTVQPFEVLILREKVKAIAGKLNRGIEKSKGEAFIILADDDKLDPTYIEKTVKKMEETKADIVGTALENFGKYTGAHQFNRVPFATSLVKKSMWEKVGGYDETIKIGEDADFYTMCINNGAKIEKVPEPLFIYRCHSVGKAERNWEEPNRLRQEKYRRLKYGYNPFT